MELQAERVRALDTAALQAQVDQVVAAVWPVLEPDPVGGEPDDGA